MEISPELINGLRTKFFKKLEADGAPDPGKIKRTKNFTSYTFHLSSLLSNRLIPQRLFNLWRKFHSEKLSSLTFINLRFCPF